MAADLEREDPPGSPRENALLQQNGWLQSTLTSIGDAVVTTDLAGSVCILNAAAQALTAWTQADAVGNPLDAVVHLIHETTRKSVVNSAAQSAWRENVVELPPQSVLIARDGAERPIDGNAAPIRNEEGEVGGVVLIFRDCTERRRKELVADEALSYATEILETLREPFLVLDETLRVVSANTAFYQKFVSPKSETVGRFIYDLGDGQWNIQPLQTLLEEAIPRKLAVRDFEVNHDFPTIGPRNMLLNASRFPPEGGHASLILLSIQDVTEQKDSIAGLEHSELRFRRLFQSAKDGILILDATSGTIIEANPFMCGLLGFELEDFLGKELWEIGLFQDKEASQANYKQLMANGYIRYEYLPLRSKSGEEVEVEFVSNLYMVGDRHVAQCNIRDITQRSRLEQQAKAQATALADLHRRKDDFLAMLSHELRNPLSPILNAVHLLRLQGDENLIQQEARQIIERQVGQLSYIIDDLLEVARFTTGKIRLNRVRLDMRGIVERAVESTRPLLLARQHKLAVDLPDVPIWLDADPTRLEQVLVNLLNNAAKYTDDGGRIWLTARAEGDSMLLSVRDSGVGIDLAKFPDIFDLFTQADRSLDRSQGGLGIGLSLVQRLVELHGGTVGVQSDGLGCGSTFTIRLPLAVVIPSSTPSPPVKSATRAAHGSHVLVVDDNVDSVKALSRLLELSGHKVRTAYTGPTAIEEATTYLPDVILLDIGLPGLSGYEVARRIRQIPALERVKLVAMTGYGSESDVQLAHEAGFDRHMVKPVQFRFLDELLRTFFPPPGPGG